MARATGSPIYSKLIVDGAVNGRILKPTAHAATLIQPLPAISTGLIGVNRAIASISVLNSSPGIYSHIATVRRLSDQAPIARVGLRKRAFGFAIDAREDKDTIPTPDFFVITSTDQLQFEYTNYWLPNVQNLDNPYHAEFDCYITYYKLNAAGDPI